jgi:hypothetical protein
MQFVNLLCTRRKVEVLIHSRLQPGDRECQDKGKPCKRFPDLSLSQFTWLQFTWLKPGVNETGLARENSIAFGIRTTFCAKPR